MTLLTPKERLLLTLTAISAVACLAALIRAYCAFKGTP